MSDGTAVDWSYLPPELLLAVATKLQTIPNYIRFRGVCQNWRAAAPKTPRYLPREFPWIMTDDTRAQLASNRCGFFNPMTNRLHRITLPEASDGYRLAGSSFGWLTLIDESPSILIINTLTRERIALPPLTSFPNVTNFDIHSRGREYTVRSDEDELCYHGKERMRDIFIKKVILSHSPSNGSDFFALAILGYHKLVAYCKNGDDKWKLIDGAHSYGDVIYFNDSFYDVGKFGSISTCDLNDENPSMVRFIHLSEQIDGNAPKYVVNAMGDLLLVLRYFELEVCELKTVKFRVLRFDWNARIWVSVSSLGERVLFLGENSALAVLASDYPGCRGDTIYFLDDFTMSDYLGDYDDVYQHGNDIGVYNLSDGTVESFPWNPSDFYWPFWITPSF